MAKIKDNTQKVLQAERELVRTKLELASLMVERDAKINCPVKTGTARRSITHLIKKIKAIVGSNVEYFPYIELGTKKMAAFAPLRKALHSNMARIKRLFGAK